MDKILTFPGRTDKGIFTYVIDAERGYLEKTAAEYHPTIASYINNAKPIKGKTQVLLTALGALEWWGDNVNGDAFPETALAHEGKDYGYKTFEYYAKVYKHHINKDPLRSYGDVLLSVYNPVFHRTELIVTISHDLAPDIISRIESGDYPDWSMGCLKPSAKILMADFNYKKISDIAKGDKVINGVGGVSEVDYQHNHKHTGQWYYISALGMNSSEIEPTTEEHPWLIIPSEEVECKGNPNNKSRKINLCFPNQDQKKACINCSKGKRSYEKIWKRADELSIGDYIATPILQGISEKPEDKMAYLLGIYLAEGHITKDGYIELNVSANDKRIWERLRISFPEVSITWNIRAHCDKAAKINIYNKDLALYVEEHAGKGSHTKKLSSKVMLWDTESQKIFIGAYCDGNGGVYKDSIYLSTCNKNLATQIQSILLRIGCISFLNVNLHKPSTIVFKDTIEYQIWVGRDTSTNLKGYSFKTQDLTDTRKIIKNVRFIYGGHLWSPIIAINTEVCDEDVYNIAVKSDSYDEDSYTVQGVSLHNCKVPFDVCSICGNKAPTRAQYCEHARYNLGRIDPATGKKVYVINTMPKFFDISLVLIGADRIAKTLKKVASVYPNIPIISSAYLAEKEAELKRAEMEKEIPPNQPPASTDTVEKAKTLANIITETKAMELPLPKKTLDELANHPLPKVMSTMVMLGIVPKPQEFQRIFLIQKGMKPLADKLDEENACFDPMSVENPSEESIKELDLGHHNFDDMLFHKLSPFMEDRSYAAPHLGRRIIIMMKSAEEPVLPRLIKLSEEKERKPLGPVAALLAAAGAYAALTHMAPKETLKGIDKLLSSKVGLGIATALGLGLIKTFNTVAGPNLKGQYSPADMNNHPDTSDVFERIEQLKQKPFNKVGSKKLPFSMSSAAKRLFLGVPLAYMASGVLQKHKEISPSDGEGRVRSFIRRNPDVVSAALVADAVLSAKGHPFSTRKLHSVVAPKLSALGKHLGYAKSAAIADDMYGTEFSKIAEAQDFLSQSLIWPLAMGRANLPGRIVGGLFDQAVLEAGSKLLKKRKNQKI